MEKLIRTHPSSLKNTFLQFGEGNFLRGFADWIIDYSNKNCGRNDGVIIVQPREGGIVSRLTAQGCLYHLIMKGLKSGVPHKEICLVESVKTGIDPYREYDSFIKTAGDIETKFIISNTTEAGITFDDTNQFDDTPAKGFPAKLTQWLHARYHHFNGNSKAAVTFLPCELIENNGSELKKIINQYIKLWGLSDEFKKWISRECTFCNTLVDRIVPGFPENEILKVQEELGYEDNMVVESELYHLFVIEANEDIKNSIPFSNTGLNIVFTDDLGKYRDRKVKVLNGAHTLMVPIGLLLDFLNVEDAINDSMLGRFISDFLFEEIVPILKGDQEENKRYAENILERFRNPFIDHKLISISLNSFSKFKTRIYPSLNNLQFKSRRIMISLAALIVLYDPANNFKINDDEKTIETLSRMWNKYHKGEWDIQEGVSSILTSDDVWGSKNLFPVNFIDEVSSCVEGVLAEGIKKVIS